MENWEREWVDYYRLLGVYPDSDSETVSAVYRRLARKYGVPGGSEPDEVRFRLINEANEILTDRDKRKRYDAEHAKRVDRDAAGDRTKGSRAGTEGSRQDDGARGEAEPPPPRPESSDSSRSERPKPRQRSDETTVPPQRRQFQVPVDYGKPLREVVAAARFDHAWLIEDERAVGSYRPTETGRAVLTVELFAGRGEYPKVLGEIDDAGLRSLDTLELAWFAVAFPAEQFKRRIRAYHSLLQREGYVLSCTEIGAEGGAGRFCQLVGLSNDGRLDPERHAVAVTPLRR